MTGGTEIQHMTARERSDLTALIRKRERVMKAAVAERSAHLLADFEQQCASIYNYDDDAVWAQAVAVADEAVKVAQEIIAKRNAELGIPAEFGPSVHMNWYERGRNAVAMRRAELRRVAMTRIAAIEKAAITQIERKSLEAQTDVLATGLETDGAKAFLASLNDIDHLMPPLDAGEIDKIVDTKRSMKSTYLPMVG